MNDRDLGVRQSRIASASPHRPRRRPRLSDRVLPPTIARVVRRGRFTRPFGPISVERSLPRDAKQAADLGPARSVVEGAPYCVLKGLASCFERCDGFGEELKMLGLARRAHRALALEHGSRKDRATTNIERKPLRSWTPRTRRPARAFRPPAGSCLILTRTLVNRITTLAGETESRNRAGLRTSLRQRARLSRKMYLTRLTPRGTIQKAMG